MISVFDDQGAPAVGVTPARMEALAKAGLDHVQISIQDSVPKEADRVAGYEGGYRQKTALANEVTRLGLRLTVNAVVHKHNITRVAEMVALAVSLERFGASLAITSRLRQLRTFQHACPPRIGAHISAWLAIVK